MSSHRLNRLIQLNAIADRALEIRFRSNDEDESHMGRNVAIGGGVAAAGAGGLLYDRGARVYNDWGGGTHGSGAMNQMKDVRDRMKAGASAFAGDARDAMAVPGHYRVDRAMAARVARNGGAATSRLSSVIAAIKRARGK